MNSSTFVSTSRHLEAAFSSELAVTLPRVVRGEWIKLRSVRSTVIVFAVAMAAVIGLGLIFSSSSGSGPRDLVDPVSRSLAGFNLSQMIIGVLGVLVVTTEYTTGLIRTTFAAVTTRTPVLWGKAIAFSLATFVIMLPAALIAFFGGQAVYSGSLQTLGISDPGALRVVIGSAVYCVGVGLIGIALGFLLRSTAAGVGVLFMSLLLLPGLIGLLPGSWTNSVTKLLPSEAGSAFMTISPGRDLLSSTAGFAVFVGWVALLIGAAAVTLKRRDA